MTCILRAAGVDFDVDAFLRTTSLIADSHWHKGEKRLPNSNSSTVVNGTSGVRLVVSKCDFSEFAQQLQDAVVFLRINQEAVKALASYPGIEHALLDFGAEIHPPGWSSFTFHTELLALAGSAGVSLSLSVYPTASEESDGEE